MQFSLIQSFDGAITENGLLNLLAEATKEKVTILRQDPWECLISFVLSSASNIPRIKKNIESIAKDFGDEIEFQGGVFHAFPEPGSLTNLKKLEGLALGYRAKYIHEINKVVDEEFLSKLSKANYAEAKEMLISLPGVGEKIADCVCLFGLQHYQAFPIDVWIARVLEEVYGKKGNYSNLSKFAQETFGDKAGLAQQYLYHWRRNLAE